MTEDPASITLSEEQAEARKLFINWLNLPLRQRLKTPFRIYGFAGTGKTTFIKYLLNEFDLNCRFAAYTGKAAMVMRQAGLSDAQTIHSMIYYPIAPDKEECNRLYALAKAEKNKSTASALWAQLRDAQSVSFALKTSAQAELEDVNLIILDEVSMVNADLAHDLKSFNIPLLVLGDPGQLPPISGHGYFTHSDIEPDVMFREIHRQAEHYPIIQLAERARQSIPFPRLKIDDVVVEKIPSLTKIDEKRLTSFDQIICGKNATRQKLNNRYRQVFFNNDFIERYPIPGDKLVCLRNARITLDNEEHQRAIFNGTQVKVLDVFSSSDYLTRTCLLESELYPGFYFQVKLLLAYFDLPYDKDALKSVKSWERKGTLEFDYGYCLTVHKAQGSQWDRVLFVDDKFLIWDRKARARWRYTAVTRAQSHITVLEVA